MLTQLAILGHCIPFKVLEYNDGELMAGNMRNSYRTFSAFAWFTPRRRILRKGAKSVRNSLVGVGLATLLLILSAWIVQVLSEEHVPHKSEAGTPKVHVGRLLDLHQEQASGF